MPTTINPSDQTITQYNIQTGGANNLLNNVAPSSTSGVPIISQGASSQPVFGTAVVAGGGTGQVTLTNHGVLIGQATSAIVATAAGSSGQVLQSGGASADPAYSTATYPATAGTSGNVLTSDGTNWTSAAGIKSVTINLSNAQIKALNSSAITILTNQGAGIVIVPTYILVKMVYGGTNVFSASGGTDICYGTTVATNILCALTGSNVWNASATHYMIASQSTFSGISFAATVVENTAISISSSAAITGNAAGDNTGVVYMQYYTVSI